MAFCRNCGHQLSDDATFCSSCGTQVAAQAQPQQAQAQYQQPVQPQQPITGDADVQQNRGIAWLSYVGLLLLVPLFARKNSEYCKFHVKQGATLFATQIAYLITQSILMAIIGAVTAERIYGVVIGHNGVYWFFNVLFSLGQVFLGVLSIIGIVNAATGKKKELILISQIPWISTLMDKIYASLNK